MTLWNLINVKSVFVSQYAMEDVRLREFSRQTLF